MRWWPRQISAMRRKIVIIGSSGLARELAWMIVQINALTPRWELHGFISKNADEIGKDLGFAEVIGDDKWILKQDFPTDVVIGIGYPQIRARVMRPYLEQADRFGFPNLIHSTATLDRDHVELGRGNVFMAGSRFTCDIKMRDFNLFNPNVTVGHDVKFGNFNVINPGVNISGGVNIHDRVLMGTGSQILENTSVGDDAIIGASALVRTPVLKGQTVVGVPARPLIKF